MNRLYASEVLVISLFLFLLATLALPLYLRSRSTARLATCANNLSQLWRMQEVYRTQFG